ncbi:HD domain-containing protein [Candidatus Woesearchaeota archaeon]|nr:HD domain-containing protein [Candidatus Woesearchaeota archaeon]
MTIIPTTKECIELLDEFEVPENIKEHSFAVNRLAMFLAKKLKQVGVDIDLDLVNAASLVHDLDKIPTLKDIPNHGKLSQKWLSERQHKKVGEVVKNHCTNLMKDLKDHTWEDKVVNYADKRCLGDKVVSLKERFDYIAKTYPVYFKEEHRTKTLQIEKEIFNKLDIKPEDIE